MPDPLDILEAIDAELAGLAAVDWDRLEEMLTRRRDAVEQAAAWAAGSANQRTAARLAAIHAAGHEILARWMGARQAIAAGLELGAREERLVETLRSASGGEEWKREWRG